MTHRTAVNYNAAFIWEAQQQISIVKEIIYWYNTLMQKEIENTENILN